MKKIYTYILLLGIFSAALGWNATKSSDSTDDFNLFQKVRFFSLLSGNLTVDVFKLSTEINASTKSEFPVAFSENNNGLIFCTQTKSVDGTISSCELCFSKYDQSEKYWSKPLNIEKNFAAFIEENKSMGFKHVFVTVANDLYTISLNKDEFNINRVNISSEFDESSPFLSPDGFTLYFSSNRPGGYGGKDLYSSEKLSNGNWSEPFNLGPMVNTASDEDCPFVLYDNVTLYFCSKGHNSIGGYDIFSSTMNYDGNWIKSENVGAPINSKFDDTYYVSDTYGKQAYYSSDKLQKGNQDIYSIGYTLNK